MNTTEIVAKLRAQAAELTAMADALEEAGTSAAFATGAGRYLIRGEVKVGDWTSYEGVPLQALAEDMDGDCFVKELAGRVWVLDGTSWSGAMEPAVGCHDTLLPSLSQCRIVALGLTGRETADDIRSIVERFKASQVPA